MKNLFILLTMLTSLSCSSEYDAILEGLNMNYVLLNNEIENELYLEYFKLTEEEHLKNLNKYNKAIKDFYNTDKHILNYLLSFEKDTTHICQWIKTKNPYSSRIDKTDLLTNAKGALILFDNYLSNSSNIRIPAYVNDLSYEEIKSFYSKNKELAKDELKKEYVKLLNNSN